jgi:ATP-dependent DNA ligase
VSRYIEQSGVALYDAAEKQGLEGIVAKRKDSLYYFGKRTKDWVKCKALLDEDFAVCGYYYKGNLIPDSPILMMPYGSCRRWCAR